MKVIYFIILRIPWVRNMQGLCRPIMLVVPWRSEVGNLLHIPAAWRPTWKSGLVICLHSSRVKDRDGAGYLRVLRIVVLSDRRAFCWEIWCVRILLVHVETFFFKIFNLSVTRTIWGDEDT